MKEENAKNDDMTVKRRKTEANREETLAYWTPERMESAEPISQEIDPTQENITHKQKSIKTKEGESDER